jgi:hypothetical protein
MSSTSRFQVHTPLLAMKSSTDKKETYVTLLTGTLGEILDVPDKLHRPGFVSIRVQGEVLYTFARDLQDNVIVERMTSNIFD